MPKKIISSTPITIAEVKELLDKRGAPLSPLQARVQSYATAFAKLSPENARALVNELVEKYELQRDEACQVANICPTHLEELRSILSGYKRLVSTILFSDEKMKAILETVNKYLSRETELEQT